MHARFYSPGTATFLSRDSVDDPLALNRYSYPSSPVSFSDPTGHSACLQSAAGVLLPTGTVNVIVAKLRSGDERGSMSFKDYAIHVIMTVGVGGGLSMSMAESVFQCLVQMGVLTPNGVGENGEAPVPTYDPTFGGGGGSGSDGDDESDSGPDPGSGGSRDSGDGGPGGPPGDGGGGEAAKSPVDSTPEPTPPPAPPAPAPPAPPPYVLAEPVEKVKAIADTATTLQLSEGFTVSDTGVPSTQVRAVGGFTVGFMADTSHIVPTPLPEPKSWGAQWWTSARRSLGSTTGRSASPICRGARSAS